MNIVLTEVSWTILIGVICINLAIVWGPQPGVLSYKFPWSHHFFLRNKISILYPYRFHVPIIFPSFSHHCPIIFPSFSHHCPIIVPSFSHHFPIIFLWCSYLFLMFPRANLAITENGAARGAVCAYGFSSSSSHNLPRWKFHVVFLWW